MKHRVVSPEYRALMLRVRHEAQVALSGDTSVLYHKCAECDTIIAVPRVYCHRCERVDSGIGGCGSSSNPRGMLIFYGYEEWE